MCARPVVASAVGGIPEQVGDAGVLVPANDVAALGEAIRTLVMHYQTDLHAATVRSRQVVEESSVHRMVDRHLKLYEKLLGSRDGQGRRPRLFRGQLDPLATPEERSRP
jgi:glycosyltransferase involved in cell wall biosynthesis